MSILKEAESLINGPRRADYGHALDNFTVIGRGWGAILRVDDIPPETVGLMMAWLKIAREVERHKEDNLVDGAGYLGTVEQVHAERDRRQAQEVERARFNEAAGQVRDLIRHFAGQAVNRVLDEHRAGDDSQTTRAGEKA